MSETTDTAVVRCDECAGNRPSYDIIHYGSGEGRARVLCSRCFNQMVAKLDGLVDFDDPRFEPVGLADADGRVRQFHFKTFLFGSGVSISAFEILDGHPGGYQFEIIGDPEGDLLALLGRLIEKIRRGMAVVHLVDEDHGRRIADAGVVRGKIDSARDHDGRRPLLIIDGREIDWDEFGRMLMSYEGWQFRLQIADKSDEL